MSDDFRGDPENSGLEFQTWSESDAPFAIAFKYIMTLKLGFGGHSRSSKVALFDRAHTTLYSSSIVNMHLSILPLPRCSR